MAGKPFKVGRFAHSLRVRLMREHLGIDVDALSEDNLMSDQPSKSEYEQPLNKGKRDDNECGVTPLTQSKQKDPIAASAPDTNQSKYF